MLLCRRGNALAYLIYTCMFYVQILAKELFRVLKERLGSDLYTHLSKRVTPVAGDITHENLGVKDSAMLQEMCREVDIVVNIAATTNFDERSAPTLFNMCIHKCVVHTLFISCRLITVYKTDLDGSAWNVFASAYMSGLNKPYF